MATRLGRLDRLVTIQGLTVTRDAVGGHAQTWAQIGERSYAERLNLRGTELFAAQQVHAEQVRRYRMRYRDDVPETARLVDGDDVLDVLYVAEIGRRAALEITAKLTRG